jgi:hypothetical protein
MSALPTPAKARALLDELGATHVADEYEWAYRALGHRNRVTDQTGTTTIANSNPTQRAALDTRNQRIRLELFTFARCLQQAVANRRGAIAALQRAFAVENGPETGLTGDWAAPRLVTNEELEHARQARKRRHQRHEGFGEA